MKIRCTFAVPHNTLSQSARTADSQEVDELEEEFDQELYFGNNTIKTVFFSDDTYFDLEMDRCSHEMPFLTKGCCFGD